ncbi:Protein phosphatase 2C 1 [Tulasnella sp. 424]|nr:Protein phosphatase 2C 1 [Tulasnella sp. 424]KAG8975551.1 Protein phosphatase 2C 1 [Tulasnella sp. 425]
MHVAFPFLNGFGGKPKRKSSMPSNGANNNEPQSSSGNASQRPGMVVFDSSPNARSKTMQTVEGAHTYGALNTMPKESGAYTLGVSENMGSRRTMEDAYSFVVDYAGIQGQGFFAVFDGHAGKHAAEWCGQHFHEMLLDKLIASPEQAVPSTIAQTFLSVDGELSKLSESGTTQSGCTAVTAFLRLEDAEGRQSFAPPIATLVQQASATSAESTSSSRSVTPSSAPPKKDGGKITRLIGAISGGAASKKASPEEPQKSGIAAIKPEGALRRVLYTANVGDARAVLSRGGKAVRLTYDHKGSDKKEVRRIQEAGGFVLNNRVNGVLAVTRSLGDSAMKEYVVGQPYTSNMELTDADDFLIIACDGLWDVIEDQPAVELIRDCTTAQAAAEALVRHALDNFSHDNVTVLVVKFSTLGGQPILEAAKATA